MDILQPSGHTSSETEEILRPFHSLGLEVTDVTMSLKEKEFHIVLISARRLEQRHNPREQCGSYAATAAPHLRLVCTGVLSMMADLPICCPCRQCSFYMEFAFLSP